MQVIGGNTCDVAVERSCAASREGRKADLRPLPDLDVLYVERRNLGRQAEQRARRHYLGKRGTRLDHGARGLHFDAKNNTRMWRPYFDPAQRILSDLPRAEKTA